MSESDTPANVGSIGSMEGLGVMVEKRCPLRIAPDTFAGCCEWYTFLPGFAVICPQANDCGGLTLFIAPREGIRLWNGRCRTPLRRSSTR